MNILTHSFYLIAIFPILWETMGIKNTKKILAFIQNMKSTDFKNYTERQKTFSFFMIGYLIWVIIGFFTSQWVLFVFLFLMGFIPKDKAWIKLIDSILSLAILLFIVINKYHL